MDDLRAAGDSIGARINIVATGVPVGLGEPVFDKLEAAIAHGMMSINAVKGVEFGDGFKVVQQRGSTHRDEITPDGFAKNSSGGTLGGISSGQDILVSIAMKPTSSIQVKGSTVDRTGKARADRDHGAPRSLRRTAGHAHRRGHAGAHADGPLLASPRPERRRAVRNAGHRH